MVTASQELDRTVREFIEAQIADLRKGYEQFQKYYRGEQNTQIPDRVQEFLPSGKEFVDNFCAVVVDALVERLNVIGFEHSAPGIDNDSLDDLNGWVWGQWQLLRMDALQQLNHLVAARDGDSYVMVSWDAEADRLSIDWQAPDMIIPYYQNGVIQFLSKRWTEAPLGEKPTQRLNLYYPNRVEKYIAQGNVWRQFAEDGDPGWPIWWTDTRMEQGSPLGIAVVHFRNNPAGDDFGMSELQSIIPLQDALNKALIDFVQVNDTMAFKQRWVANVLAPDGGYDISPGSVWHMESEETEGGRGYSVGEFEASNPEHLIRSMEHLVDNIAAISRTPKHLFQLSGDYPSGEALKTAESGLVKKAERRMVGFGNSWEDVMMMAHRVAMVFGTDAPAAPEGWHIEAVWDDAESRNEESHLNALVSKQSLGVSQRQLWREMGYDQAQIEQMEEEKADERNQTTTLGAALLANFDRGDEES